MRRKRKQNPMAAYCRNVVGDGKLQAAEKPCGEEEILREGRPGKEAVRPRKHHGWEEQ